MSGKGKPIPGAPGYTISRNGTVMSDRQAGGGGGRKAKPHKVKATDHGHRYHRVVLMINGKKATKYVHDLVHSAHGKGKKKDGQQIRHLDGNKDHNSAGNLKPGSASENAYDKGKARKSQSTEVCKSFSINVPQFHIVEWNEPEGDDE